MANNEWHANTQAEFNAALINAKKAGGGTIHLGKGAFIGKLPDNTRIEGVSRRETILSPDDTSKREEGN